MKKKILIFGGSGFLGKSLIRNIRNPDLEWVIISRTPPALSAEIYPHRWVSWDGETVGNWQSELEGAFAVINLSGKSVDCRYTKKNREKILRSRVLSTRAIGQAVSACKKIPSYWINASTATIYRDSRDKEMDEFMGELGMGFSEEVAKTWEAEFNSFDLPSTKKILIRTSLVIGKNGGVWPVLKKLIKLRLGGNWGDGKQMISWIHEQDFCSAIQWLLENKKEGVYNLTAPFPLNQERFFKEVRKRFKISLGLPIPKPLLETGAFFIRTETELILKSRFVVPLRLMAEGFNFQLPRWQDALKQL